MMGIGYKAPVKCCQVSCVGEGPVMSVEPLKLDWGELQLLHKSTMSLELINDSPIPAEFNTTFVSSP